MTLTWQPSLSCQNTLCKMVLDRLRKVTSPDEVIAAFNTGEEASLRKLRKAQAVKEALQAINHLS